MGIIVPNHPADRFFRFVDKRGDCHLWIGGKAGKFGIFAADWRRPMSAHKFAYEWANGPAPFRAVITQTCRNPLCVNPKHLITLEPQEARAAGLAGGRDNVADCKNGHPLSGDNLYVDPRGKRNCRTCRRASKLRLRASS